MKVYRDGASSGAPQHQPGDDEDDNQRIALDRGDEALPKEIGLEQRSVEVQHQRALGRRSATLAGVAGERIVSSSIATILFRPAAS